MTRDQTVVNVPKEGPVFYTVEPRPICPLPQSKWPDKYGFSLSVENGTMRWSESGMISESGEVSRFWVPKPTIHDIVRNPYGPVGVFTQIHKDGSINSKINGVPYYWGSECESVIMKTGNNPSLSVNSSAQTEELVSTLAPASVNSSAQTEELVSTVAPA